ncbi:MAG: hypothetical protein RSG59_09365 [Ruthenibacterium sp.]
MQKGKIIPERDLSRIFIGYRPDRVYDLCVNKIAVFIKANQRVAGLTQEEFALSSWLGLRFARELEQGKETVRMDKETACHCIAISILVLNLRKVQCAILAFFCSSLALLFSMRKSVFVQ